MRLGFSALVVAVALGLASEPAQGQSQEPAQREGLWFGVGVGAGFGSASCSICQNDNSLGLSGVVGLGWTLTPKFLLGLEGSAWAHYHGQGDDNDDLRSFLGSISLSGRWYPNPAKGLFLSLGVGPVFYRLDDVSTLEEGEGRPAAVTSTSIGGRVGVAYDLMLAGNVAFTPFFNFVGSLYGDLTTEGSKVDDTSLTLVQFGVGLSLY